MTERTTAEKLAITEGDVVWVIGRTVEETALLDPLPEGAETVEERDEDDPDRVDAAILFADTRSGLVDDLDEVIPQLGSIPVVWISYPLDRRAGLDAGTITELVADYGWGTVDDAAIDETWRAVRLRQA